MRRDPFALLALALLCAPLAGPARADLVVGERGMHWHPARFPTARLHLVDTDTDTVVSSVDLDNVAVDAMVLAPDGWIYSSTNGPGRLRRYLQDGTTEEYPDVYLPDAHDFAVDGRGDVLALDAGTVVDPASGVQRVAVPDRQELVVTVPGVEFWGMDVPRAGPLEDGILAIGWSGFPPAPYMLHRWRRADDGSLVPEGPFGPLELFPFGGCPPSHFDYFFQYGSHFARHVAARADGESFLVAETCDDTVREFDLEGRFLGVFAEIEPDPTILDPSPTDPHRVAADQLSNIHVTAEDHVYVASLWRVRHFDPDGRLVRTVDAVFGGATALADTRWRPFASQDGACAPLSVGAWKRACLAEADALPRLRPGTGAAARLRRPGPHPRFADEDVPALLDRASARLSRHGVTACDALWPAAPREARARALAGLAAVLLNLESRRLAPRCPATVRGQPTDVATLLATVEELLDEGTETAFREADRLTARLLAARDGDEIEEADP